MDVKLEAFGRFGGRYVFLFFGSAKRLECE